MHQKYFSSSLLTPDKRLKTVWQNSPNEVAKSITPVTAKCWWTSVWPSLTNMSADFKQFTASFCTSLRGHPTFPFAFLTPRIPVNEGKIYFEPFVLIVLIFAADCQRFMLYWTGTPLVIWPQLIIVQRDWWVQRLQTHLLSSWKMFSKARFLKPQNQTETVNKLISYVCVSHKTQFAHHKDNIQDSSTHSNNY